MNDLATLLGTAAAFALDPIVFALGFLGGSASPSWRVRLIVVAVAAMALAVLMAAISPFPLDRWAIIAAFGRALALLVWATVGWGVRRVVARAEAA